MFVLPPYFTHFTDFRNAATCRYGVTVFIRLRYFGQAISRITEISANQREISDDREQVSELCAGRHIERSATCCYDLR